MHELSLLESVREIVEQEAERQHFSRVKCITLAIGELSCIEADALRFAFDVVMKDSLAADAELMIERVEAIGRCQHCGAETSMQALQDVCAVCERYGLEILQGDGMQIKELLVI